MFARTGNQGVLRVDRSDARRSWGILMSHFLRRRVDPHCLRQIGWCGRPLDEPLWVRHVGGREDPRAVRVHGLGLAVVDDGIQTVNKGNPALKAILAEFSVDDGEVRIQKSNLFGLEIENAIILRAKKPGRAALSKTAMESTARR